MKLLKPSLLLSLLGVLSACTTVPSGQICPSPPASLLVRPEQPTLLAPQLTPQTSSTSTSRTPASTQSAAHN